MAARSEKNRDRAKRFYLESAEKYIESARATNNQQCLDKAAMLYQEAVSIGKNNLRVKSRLGFKDVGGLEDVKEDIKMKIIEPMRNPDIFRYYGKKLGGGILMYGPPGCGKSLIAEATAGEADATFFHVKASDIKSKYVGETERNIAELFSEAGKEGVSIIFFDEFEALGGERSNADVHDKNAVSQLLTEMDGLGNKDKRILFIGATNEPWDIDIALRREGRFGTTIFIPPPDFYARISIFSIHLKSKPLADDVNIAKLAYLTEGYSGADIMGICEAATEIPLKEYLKAGRKRQVCFKDFVTVLAKRRSSVQPWFAMASKRLKGTEFQEAIAYGKRHYKECFLPCSS